ncbi:putative lipid II flippase FtsW [Paenibacillus xerothermodurans]|uniref:Probable peptidoglycan glycosyltransferase FtsW n=1 Tax=Paenibacillus xerothermodurans TaxID=1977292 RepID=A0A2W1NVC7_PAEXE|nr:putative lipid II flippase FtsW [Paenibacillus xerothermodurans]PZE22543.1 putative lipid II flippase FtsW [Paenibacillus xerothermodurans]
MTPQKRGTPDFLLLFLTFLLVSFGLAMVFSASMSYYYDVKTATMLNDPSSLAIRQAAWIAVGTVAMFFFMNIDYRKIKKWIGPAFVIVVIILLLVPVVGKEVNGATSWIEMGPLGNIQPSEFAKLAVILYLAALISKKEDKMLNFKRGLLPGLAIVVFISGLIMLQPDLGSTAILVLSSLIVIIVGGANLKHIFYLGTAGAALASVVIAAAMLKPERSYRIARLTAFLDPSADPSDTGYQLMQSLYAFGHGGITGAGFGQGIQKLHYLPEAHTDFIFSIIGEELGFIGAAIFALVYLAFLWRGVLVALRCKEMFGTLVSIGIIGMIGVQALINLGGVTSSIPLTGVTLPLISYGGSSMLITLASLGILLSISREYNKPEKEKNKRA